MILFKTGSIAAFSNKISFLEDLEKNYTISWQCFFDGIDFSILVNREDV